MSLSEHLLKKEEAATRSSGENDVSLYAKFIQLQYRFGSGLLCVLGLVQDLVLWWTQQTSPGRPDTQELAVAAGQTIAPGAAPDGDDSLAGAWQLYQHLRLNGCVGFLVDNRYAGHELQFNIFSADGAREFQKHRGEIAAKRDRLILVIRALWQSQN